MRLPLSRTREILVHQAKGFIFDKANFQKMIDLRERHELEDSMGFRGQWDEHRRFQIDILKKQGLRPEHTLLELGCGPMTGGIPIIEYLQTGNYVGVDIRSSVLNLSWREIGKAGLSAKNPRLICSSNFAFDYLGNFKFDFIYSFSVLFHLSDKVLDTYFAAVASRLNADGACFANVNTHLPSDKWLEFPFIMRTIDDYARVAQRHGIVTISLGTLKDLGFINQTDDKENLLLQFTLLSSKI